MTSLNVVIIDRILPYKRVKIIKCEFTLYTCSHVCIVFNDYYL